MPARSSYDYAVIRVVPRVEREEFVNAGVIVLCSARDFLEARVELDERRVLALAPDADLEAIHRHLAGIPAVCRGGDDAGPIGRLSARARFDWLVAPRSTVIQTSAVHTGRCGDPAQLIERLLEWLRREGVRDVVLNLHHLPHTITRVVGDGAHLGLRARYSWEPVILGSAGGPRRALPLLEHSACRDESGTGAPDLLSARTQPDAASMALAPVRYSMPMPPLRRSTP